MTTETEPTARAPYQLLPDPPPEEYAALKDDIRRRGVLVPVEKDEAGHILDGHQRVRAWGELRAEGVALPDFPVILRPGLTEAEKRAHVRSLNLHRRHLSREQRRALIAEQLREDPGKSDRQVAEALKVSPTTVGSVRAGLEEGGQLSKLDSSVGKDGKARRRPSVLARTRREEERAAQALRQAPAESLPAKMLDVRGVERVARVERPAPPLTPVTPRHPDVEVFHGDLGLLWDRLADGSVDLFLTDPPWTEADAYDRLGRLAAAKLKPGALCLAYAGQYNLLDVGNALGRHLPWWWEFVIRLKGPLCRMWQQKLWVKHRPVLAFHRPPCPDRPAWLLDLVEDEPDKAHHEWGQGERAVEYLMGRLTAAGALVVDRFVGGGTTAAVAARLGRRFLGCDLDPRAVATARARLAEAPRAGGEGTSATEAG
jgi:ParB-like chromosome segregation protein Spo0J